MAGIGVKRTLATQSEWLLLGKADTGVISQNQATNLILRSGSQIPNPAGAVNRTAIAEGFCRNMRRGTRVIPSGIGSLNGRIPAPRSRL